MSELHTPFWPLERNSINESIFLCSDLAADPAGFGGVLEPYWLNSEGCAVVGRFSEPPLVQILKHRINLISNGEKTILKIYKAKTDAILNEFHLEIMKLEFGFPSTMPNELVFKKPFWSTWAVFKKEISMAKISDFLDKISAEKLPIGILGIDDEWTQFYGDSTFNTAKFGNDPKAALGSLKKKHGVKVVLWTHPFLNELSENFFPGLVFPDKMKWWNGIDFVYDFTKDETVQFFREKLTTLLEFGVDGFKFDAGETSYMPKSLLERGYSSFLAWQQNYIKMAAGFPLKIEEVRISSSTQNCGIILRLIDKNSTWDRENGIKSIIPNVLICSLLGYPFVMTDMIGGNAYNGAPDRELYIRWLQLATLLPIMQFSLPPWDFDEAVEIARKMLNLREKYADLLVRLAEDATVTGAPIIRPLWWGEKVTKRENQSIIDQLFTCSDQFFLGEEIVVAPIIEPGVKGRSVVLPSGIWKGLLDGMHYQGPTVIRQPAGLDALIVYEKVEML